MVKERTLRAGAYVFAVLLFALPATRASFAQDGPGHGHDLKPQTEDSAPVSHPLAGGGATPDEHGQQKAAATPAPKDGSAAPNSMPSADDQHVRQGRGEGLQSAGFRKTGAGSDKKASPAFNAPPKGLGPTDTPLVVPLQRSTETTDKLHPGNKAFKIVTPERSLRFRAPGAVPPKSTIRNAIGQAVTARDVIPSHASGPLGQLASRSPGVEAGGAGNVIDANRYGGATRVVVAPNLVPPVALSGERRIVGAGPNRSGAALSGLGGPAKTVSGINGTAVRPIR
jgi:hypothetical protein